MEAMYERRQSFCEFGAERRAGRSHLGPTCATSCGAQGHCAQLGTRLQRASELSKVPPTVELEEARSGAAGRQALWHAVRLTWHGQKWAGSGSRMQRGSTVGLPGVAGRSWPCPPLDLLRSPAGGVESTRSAMCVLPLSLPFFSAVARSTPDLDGYMETVRERLPM